MNGFAMRRTGIVLILALLPIIGMRAQLKEKSSDYSPTLFSRLIKHVE